MMKKLTIIISFFAVLLAAIVTVVYLDTNTYKVHTVHFQTDKLPRHTKLRIVQISDLHDKVFDEGNESLVNSILEQNADLIVLTGDLIDRKTNDFTNVFAMIESITSHHDHVYYVSGNHEWWNRGTEHFFDGLRERNVTILNNRHTHISLNDATVNLVGVDDASTGHEDIRAAFHGINQDDYTIFLSHTPSIVDSYEELPADLILSGHTHGGQVRVPFIGAIVAPDQGFLPKLDKGVFQIHDNQYLYIDSGLGTSVLPLRFMNKSQFSVIEVESVRTDRDQR